MIWLIPIPFVIFFTFKNMVDGDWLMMKGHWNFLSVAFTIFVGLFISAIISAALCGVGAAIGSIPDVVGRKDQTYPLVTLRERDGIEGRFYFLGAGSINDAQYYFWYRRDTDGAIRGGKTYRSPGVRIYEIEDGEPPYMVTFKTEYVNASISRWFWIIGIDTRDERNWSPDFHIPKGSIKEGYVL